MPQIDWVVLVYKVPSEPTKYRAAVWREIKRLGGIYIQDGVCIFPDIDDVSLNVSSLAGQVRQFGGTEFMFFTKSPTQIQASHLVELFQQVRTEEYEALQLELGELQSQASRTPSEDLDELQSRFKKLKRQASLIKARDYFDCPLGLEIITSLQKTRLMITQLARGEMSL